MSRVFDAIIVGCGPAGMFAALELSKLSDLKILMLDKGRPIEKRICWMLQGIGCKKICNPCNLKYGWGGAGTFSDGKINISSDIGGWLNEYRPSDILQDLAEYVDSILVKFGAPDNVYGTDEDKIDEIRRKSVLAGLKFIPYKIRHLGTDNCPKILSEINKYLTEKGIEIRTRTEVESFVQKDGKIQGVKTRESPEIIRSKYVIACPGRGGALWLESQMQKLGVPLLQNPIDVGIRVEVPAVVMEPLTEVVYEPKFIYTGETFDDEARVFCVCPNGEVISESFKYHNTRIVTVNGQGYTFKKTANTNFAILVRTKFTRPFKSPMVYASLISNLANLLTGQNVIVQRVKDLKKGRRSTKARIKRSTVNPTLKTSVPGDLSFVLPYRYLKTITEMLQTLDEIIPGVYSDDTLVYGIETKLYTSRPKCSLDLETANVANLFVAGDGAGLTRSLMQAAISGILAARSIHAKVS